MKQIKMLSAGLILSIICFSVKAQEMQNSKPLLVHTVYINATSENRNDEHRFYFTDHEKICAGSESILYQR